MVNLGKSKTTYIKFEFEKILCKKINIKVVESQSKTIGLYSMIRCEKNLWLDYRK